LKTDSTDRELIDFHERIDVEAKRLAGRHGERLQCRRGCSDCCVDEVGIFEVEARRIRHEVGEGLLGEVASPAGHCAFLDPQGACRIYSARPYVCRTQGLPLRWIDYENASEQRDICPLNEPGPDLLSLAPEFCWEIGPNEAELGYLESRRQGDSGVRGSLERISLRDLFDELSG
jgi:Fe-S-cluster containining protein